MYRPVDLKEDLRKLLSEELRGSSKEAVSSLFGELSPLLLKFCSYPAVGSMGAGVRLGLRHTTDALAERYGVSAGKLNDVVNVLLKKFAFKLEQTHEIKSQDVFSVSSSGELIVDFFLQCKPDDLSRYVVLTAFGAVSRRVTELLDNTSEIGRIVNGTYKGVGISLVTAGIGCPSTAIYIEALSRTAAEYLLRVGSTGALQEWLDLGDLVIPLAAVRAEGTTPYYVQKEYPATGSSEIIHALQQTATELGHTHHSGVVVTTDAIFRESEDLLQKWNRMGALSLDMETSALFIISQLKGLKAGSILAVSDHPFKGVRFYHPEAHDERKHPGFVKAIETALESIVCLEKKC